MGASSAYAVLRRLSSRQLCTQRAAETRELRIRLTAWQALALLKERLVVQITSKPKAMSESECDSLNEPCCGLSVLLLGVQRALSRARLPPPRSMRVRCAQVRNSMPALVRPAGFRAKPRCA